VAAFSEYGIVEVSRAVLPNRALREAGLLEVRDGPFGEGLDTFRSRAFAVCDHQVAHVYARDATEKRRAVERLGGMPGVARVLEGETLRAAGLGHERAGDLVLLAERDAWFAYPYWLDERRAPDFARTVDIHRKPGYDPLELLVDPEIPFPRLRVARRLLSKALGRRYLMDVVPLDPSLVKGSHGLLAATPEDGPVLVTDGSADAAVKGLRDLSGHVRRRMGLA
jgi:hypothetical protein